MPRARANISAKFIAHTEIGVTVLSSTRAPADATRPARVSISGRPAATRLPKASTRISSVTGQDIISAFIIASWLAWLKSLHSIDWPVGRTSMVSVPRAVMRSERSSARRTMSSVSAAAPAMRMPVCPSSLTVTPGVGGMMSAMRSSALSRAVASSMTSVVAVSPMAPSAVWITTWIAEDALPPKCSWARSRTATDSEPFACQPAPASELNTEGAAAPRPTRTSSQTPRTAFMCVAVQAAHRARTPCGGGVVIEVPFIVNIPQGVSVRVEDTYGGIGSQP